MKYPRGSILDVYMYISLCVYIYTYMTYLPREAVAEVSNHKECIGRGHVEFNWFESRLISDSNELRVK